MDSKIIFIVIILFCSCKSQKNIATEESIPTLYSEQEILDDRENSKKYALCSCLFINDYKYKDSTVKDNSAYTYISKGLKHPQFYSDIFNFTQEQIKKINYKSLEGGNVVLKIAECLDFYDSIELEEFIIKIENKDFNN